MLPLVPLRRSLLLIGTILLLSAPAHAQYMFLDATDDGLHDSSDVLNPSGPTRFDVWIRTDQNRDGSAAACVTEDGELTINSYEFTLRVTNGEVEWGSFTNRQPLFTIDLGSASSSTEFHIGLGGGEILPPGTYRLGTLSATPVSGTPSLEFSPTSDLSGVFLTSFGSRCSGTDFDNTLKLGLDWHDTDGLSYGGVINHPPTLQPIENMVVTEDQTLDQPIYANDPDGQPVWFHKIDGPGFMEVFTISEGSGAAIGRVRLAPGPRDAGFYFVAIGVSDGVFVDRRDFEVRVFDVNHAPFFHLIPDVRITAGTEEFNTIAWSDPDGNGTAVSVTVVAGPDYFSLHLFPGLNLAFGAIRPAISEAGRTDTVTLAASDGELRSETSFRITVQSAPAFDPVPDLTVAAGSVLGQRLVASDADGDPVQFSKVSGPGFVQVSTLDPGSGSAIGEVQLRPGAFDVGWSRTVVAVSDGLATREMSMRVVVTTPNGGLSRRSVLTSNFLSFDTVQEAQGLALDNFDGDQIPDIAVVGRSTSFQPLLSLFSGLGDGSFRWTLDLDVPYQPSGLVASRLDEDEHTDLVVPTQSGLVSVFLGMGNGAWAPRSDYPVQPNCHDVAVADLDGDMRPEIIAVGSQGVFQVLRNTGDGHFQEGVLEPAVPSATISAGDLNRDGLADVVSGNYGEGPISVYLGNGDGTFQRREYPMDRGIGQVMVRDVNRDGNQDLIASGGGLVDVLTGDGAGNLTPWNSTPVPEGGSFDLASFDENDIPDLVVAQTYQNSVTLLRGAGNGDWNPGTTSFTGFYPSALVSGDLNMDGQVDLITANLGGSISVFLGTGGGNFASTPLLPTAASPLQVMAADLNGDTRRDVVSVGNDPHLIEVRLQNVEGSFSPGPPVPARGIPSAAALADWNNDSILDLAYGRSGEHALSLHWGDGTGGFTSGVDLALTVHPSDLEGVDVNHDSLLDLVVAPGSILLNAGNGSFHPPIPTPNGLGEFIAVGLIDTDEFVDIVGFDSYSFEPKFTVARGGGDGTFSPHFTYRFEGSWPQALRLADMDQDGRLDLVVAHGQDPGWITFRQPGHVSMFRGRGDGTFDAPTTYDAGRRTSDLAIEDLNQDGTPDVLASDTHSNSVSLFPNEGNGTLGVRVDHGTRSYPVSLAIGDVDRDGRPDVLTADARSRSITILHNVSGGPNRAPTASSGGPYTGVRNVPVSFSASGSSDPDGEPLSFQWDFGDGGEGRGVFLDHVYTSAGSYRVILTVNDSWFSIGDTTSTDIGDGFAARVFRKGSTANVPLGAGAPLFCVQLEPVEGSYVNSDLVPSSLLMISNATGSVGQIPAIEGKTGSLSDSDRNGVEEVTVCFRREDILALFDALRSKTALDVRVEGRLHTGAPVQATLRLSILPIGQGPSSAIYPNPLNPSGMLTFHLPNQGRVRVLIVDVQGRRLGTILDAILPSGYHDVAVGEGSSARIKLSSGVYFYMIESADGVRSGRFTVLK